MQERSDAERLGTSSTHEDAPTCTHTPHAYLDGGAAVEDDDERHAPAAHHRDTEARPDADISGPVEAQEVGVVEVHHVLLRRGRTDEGNEEEHIRAQRLRRMPNQH